MHDTSWVEINLSRLDQNLAAFRRLTQGDDPTRRSPRFCVTVKANAYGLGAVAIARRLLSRGVDMLAVYSPQQAEELIRNAIHCPILLLMPLRTMARQDPLYRPAAAGMLHVSIHDLQQLDDVSRFAQMLGLNLPVHLYFDTGMSRSGLSRRDMVEALTALPQTRNVRLAGIYSHFATAGSDESFAFQQLEHFEAFIDEHARLIPKGTTIHLANTFAVLRDRRFHKDMVRLGLGMYGYGPDLLTGGSIIGEVEPLAPVVRWVSQLVHVARYPRGATVGYDATHALSRDSVLGLVPVGYGDGYPVSASNKAVVCLPELPTGKPYAAAPVVGRVSMDQMVVDLTDLVAAMPTVNGRSEDICRQLLRTKVELISDDPTSPCSLPAVANAAGTNCYEILCRISPSVSRRYVAPEARAIAATAKRTA